jgi:hypothetical protein
VLWCQRVPEVVPEGIYDGTEKTVAKCVHVASQGAAGGREPLRWGEWWPVSLLPGNGMPCNHALCTAQAKPDALPGRRESAEGPQSMLRPGR